MSEKLLFVLPEYWEETLHAISVIMQYLETRVVVGRTMEKVTIKCPDQLQSFVKACWWPAEVVTELTEEHKDADLVVDFDTDVAYELAVAQKKYLSDVYAIQLGVGLLRILPPIAVENYKEESGYVLVVERNKHDRPLIGAEWMAQREKFIEIGQENDIQMGYLDGGAYWKETLSAVGRASVVVGIRGTATMVAASAGKIVLELASSSWEHQNWMGKWHNRNFSMAYGKIEDMSPEMLWEKLRTMVEKGTRFNRPEVVNV